MTRPLTRHAKPAPKRAATPGWNDRGYGTPKADSIKAAEKALRRTRTLKTFVLSTESKDLDLPCNVCGKALDNPYHGDGGDKVPKGYHGNRVDFIRKNGRSLIRPKHYWCAMGALLEGVCTSRDLGEAARKVEKLNGGWIDVATLGRRKARKARA